MNSNVSVTPDILEKNGFNHIHRQSEKEFDMYLYLLNLACIVKLIDRLDGLWDLTIEFQDFGEERRYIKFENVFLKVSELKDALRLCGYEQLSDNFKE